MINFRYHVVSLTAVFLALAIGLVVGTAALNGPVADSLNDSVNAVSKDNKNLREQVEHLREEVNREEDFGADVAPFVLAGTLTGRRVLVVSLPSGREFADKVEQMLLTADAKIAGRVDVQDKFTDPTNGLELLDLAEQASVPSVPVAGLPANSDGVETSSALLAAVLMDREPAVPVSDRRSVLTAYSKAGYLSLPDEGGVAVAEAVVVVAGLPYTDRDAPAKNKNAVTVAVQFDKAAATVVAGAEPTGEGNLVAAVRGDPTLAKTISTVDNAGTVHGQLVTAMAIARQLGDQVGHYGVGPGAQSLLPKRAQ